MKLSFRIFSLSLLFFIPLNGQERPFSPSLHFLGGEIGNGVKTEYVDILFNFKTKFPPKWKKVMSPKTVFQKEMNKEINQGFPETIAFDRFINLKKLPFQETLVKLEKKYPLYKWQKVDHPDGLIFWGIKKEFARNRDLEFVQDFIWIPISEKEIFTIKTQSLLGIEKSDDLLAIFHYLEIF